MNEFRRGLCSSHYLFDKLYHNYNLIAYAIKFFVKKYPVLYIGICRIS